VQQSCRNARRAAVGCRQAGRQRQAPKHGAEASQHSPATVGGVVVLLEQVDHRPKVTQHCKEGEGWEAPNSCS
jgi:hypothetical protein